MTGAQRNRLERLARELAAGKTVEAAMLAAGYAEKSARDGRLRRDGRLISPYDHPAVRAELEAIQTAAREGAAVTLNGELERLNRLFHASFDAGKWSIARQCCMDRLKAAGLLVDRKQIEIPPISEMTESQLVALLGEEAEGGG